MYLQVWDHGIGAWKNDFQQNTRGIHLCVCVCVSCVVCVCEIHLCVVCLSVCVCEMHLCVCVCEKHLCVCDGEEDDEDADDDDDREDSDNNEEDDGNENGGGGGDGRSKSPKQSSDLILRKLIDHGDCYKLIANAIMKFIKKKPSPFPGLYGMTFM